ncbi:phage portal protein [Shinella kummerowiae]|uniref:Phage portal protein n=1 Tax=Shinella kummerowiae TaxID=417745 RepID=A0A6N8SKA4_9HYPH|nr:phage portal protein [Shinella kummerowiae]MXN48797.1 phage portal protein [Shinella kummerowiae]
MKLWPFSRTEKLETRDENLKDEDGVLDALWGGQESGSVAVSGAAALRVPAVAAAVRVISEAAACLPVRIMRRAEGGTETEDLHHPIGDMLRGDVNSWTSGFELIRDLTADALTRDWGGLAYVNRVGDEVREIIRYQPSMISVAYEPKTGEPEYRIEGVRRRSAEILHVRGPFDRSPLTLAAEAIGTAKIMEEHAANFFKNGAMPGSVILNKKGLGAKGALEMLKGWRAAFQGPSKTGKTAVLWDDADVKQLGLNSVDSQFLELRTFQILEIARAFRVPPSMLFELDRATWSNSEQMGREFLIYCLEPWLKALETSLARALFTKDERKRYRILLDRDDLTRADLTARATAINSLISAKVLNPNEGRNWLDLAPYEGGDEYGNPHINPNAPGPGHNGGPPLEDEKPEDKEPPADEP